MKFQITCGQVENPLKDGSPPIPDFNLWIWDIRPTLEYKIVWGNPGCMNRSPWMWRNIIRRYQCDLGWEKMHRPLFKIDADYAKAIGIPPIKPGERVVMEMKFTR